MSTNKTTNLELNKPDIGSTDWGSDVNDNWDILDSTIAGERRARNLIIGGDFSTNPWQRGTSFTSLTSGVYFADRFAYGNTSSAVIDAAKTEDAPTADEAGLYTGHCLHLCVTTGDTDVTGTDHAGVVHRIEGLNAAHLGFGQSGVRYCTLSFWHKHTVTGTYCVAIRNSAHDRSYVAEYDQTVADTWEKAEITIPVDTSGTWLYDTGIGLRLAFALAVGETYQTVASTWSSGNYLATANQVNALATAGNNFKIALVQLESGASASDFEYRDAGTELRLCQRYYESGCYIIRAFQSTNTDWLQFATTKRSIPTASGSTIQASNASGFYLFNTAVNGTEAYLVVSASGGYYWMNYIVDAEL